MTEWPARRIRRDLPNGRLEFSVPEGVSDDEAFAEFMRMAEAIAGGHTRKDRYMDGRPRARRYRLRNGEAVREWAGPFHYSYALSRWAFWSAWSYVEMWALVAWRATFGRRRRDEILQTYRDALFPVKAGVE